CGVTTGLGAVFNTARVRAGATVAVIGCGGIGLSVIQGCRIAGAGRIIAVDTVAWKLDLAARLGATDGVNAAEMNPVASVVEMTTGGVDYAFEALGTPTTVRQAVRMTRKGGTIVMIGVVPMGTSVELPGADIVLREKTILGCMMGSNRFRIDMPRYVDLYRKGLLRLDETISARLPLERVNDALDALRRGTAARSVVVFESRAGARSASRRGRRHAQIRRRGCALHPVDVPGAVDGDEGQRVGREPGLVHHSRRHEVEPAGPQLGPLPF